MTCSRCHRHLPDDSAFCHYCGERLAMSQPTVYQAIPHDGQIAEVKEISTLLQILRWCGTRKAVIAERGCFLPKGLLHRRVMSKTG